VDNEIFRVSCSKKWFECAFADAIVAHNGLGICRRAFMKLLRSTALTATLMTAAVPLLTNSANAWGWGWRGGGWGWGAPGLAAGPLIGGAVVAPYYGYGYPAYRWGYGTSYGYYTGYGYAPTYNNGYGTVYAYWPYWR
jgi:hypothetical protein